MMFKNYWKILKTMRSNKIREKRMKEKKYYLIHLKKKIMLKRFNRIKVLKKKTPIKQLKKSNLMKLFVIIKFS